jgi:hypothetical protein
VRTRPVETARAECDGHDQQLREHAEHVHGHD